MLDRPIALRAVLVAAISTAFTAARAAADVPCDMLPPLDELAGAYDVTIGNALISDGGRIVPLRAQHAFTATMEAQGELLMMEADDNVVVLEYADPEDGVLNYEELRHVLNIGVSDFPALFGCSLERLPALRGGGLAESQEGAPIEFEYELVVWDFSSGELPEMFGIVRWGGGGITSVRAVSVSPQS